MPTVSAPMCTAAEAALLLALLPPPPGLVPLSTGRRPLGNTPERVALAWLRRAGEALVAALMTFLLLFHISFSVPDGTPTTEPSTSSAESTATAPALSPSQAWSVAWADFVAPPVAAQGFGYVAVPVPTMVAVLASLHSTFANAVDVETVDAAAQAVNLNPLLLFACIGAEQPWNLRAAYPSDWRDYAGNPFDIAVYGAWHPTGYTPGRVGRHRRADAGHAAVRRAAGGRTGAGVDQRPAQPGGAGCLRHQPPLVEQRSGALRDAGTAGRRRRARDAGRPCVAVACDLRPGRGDHARCRGAGPGAEGAGHGSAGLGAAAGGRPPSLRLSAHLRAGRRSRHGPGRCGRGRGRGRSSGGVMSAAIEGCSQEGRREAPRSGSHG